MTLGQILFAALAASAAAAITDLWRFKVYNALTIPSTLLGLVAALAWGGWAGLAWSLLGSALGFALLAPLFAMGGVGAGDVKLLMALGAWLGPLPAARAFVGSGLATGCYASALVLIRSGPIGLAVEVDMARRSLRSPRSAARPRGDLARELARPGRRRRLVPYAAMTFVGLVGSTLWFPSRPGDFPAARADRVQAGPADGAEGGEARP